jgi:hypothetical protein
MFSGKRKKKSDIAHFSEPDFNIAKESNTIWKSFVIWQSQLLCWKELSSSIRILKEFQKKIAVICICRQENINFWGKRQLILEFFRNSG